MIKNKRGASFSTWTTGILLILLFLVVLSTTVLTPLNTTYSKDYSTGIDTSSLDDFEAARQTADAKISNSTVVQTDSGLSLTETWGITKIVYNAVTSFLTGGFIDNLLTNVMGLPAIVGTVFRILFLMSLIFIIVYLFMKVKP